MSQAFSRQQALEKTMILKAKFRCLHPFEVWQVRLYCPKSWQKLDFFFSLNCPIKEYNEIKLIFIETHPWILGDIFY